MYGHMSFLWIKQTSPYAAGPKKKEKKKYVCV